MGVRQSSPVADSRTRAYSSPVPPSGGSTTPGFRYTAGPGGPQIHYTGWNQPSSYHQTGISIPHGGQSRSEVFGNSLDLEESDWERGEHRLMIGSLPLHLSPHLLGGFHCPVCSKFVVSDEMEIHLVMCLTKPRLTYNEDVLEKDSEECAICLDEMEQGDVIARLPCLCIYHKGCIDEWFEVNRSCPEHPSD
ncbi:E3 ubiquitin-protein ligase znrf2 [Coregonus clupeaformis]|uniref:E3 ubiquitin-protein ligase znrf2 n=1 Tax=Coregonus clupeaformis TaxID=59861 RepID=UPI001BE1058A|nr:E3 ubiquitin-protein ligase znrf2 [Coregonus clupeaformis]